MFTPPKCYTTTEWGAEAPQGTFDRSPAEGIVIHNTESANRSPQVGAAEEKAIFELALTIQHEHMHGPKRHWSDSGQNFTLSRGGLLVEGRHGSLAAAVQGLVVRGAHASGVARFNRTYFGIEVEGDNRKADQVTPKQWEALVEWCAWLTLWSGRDKLPLIAHHDVTPDDPDYTDCPGKFRARIPQLQAAVDARVVALHDHPSRVALLAAAVPASLPAYKAPKYIEDRLAEAPWEKAQLREDMNGYSGLVQGSFHTFLGIAGLKGGAALYESKFAIDGDGDAAPVPGDTYQPDTSLHMSNGTPLNATTYPFAVIPMVKPSNKRLPDFESLGIRLGDVGMAYWHDRHGILTYAPFAYGDTGPKWEKIGEGSRYLAHQLAINDDPNVGGIDAKEIPPGIVHIVFPGTSDVQDFKKPKTSRSRDDIAALVSRLINCFFSQV